MNKHRKTAFVLMVTNVYFPVIGGISTYIKDLSEEIKKLDVQVKILSFPLSWSKLPRRIRWVLYLLFIIYVLIEAVRLKHKRTRIIVHSHSASFCLAAASAARYLFGCKTLHTFHSPLESPSLILTKLTPHLDNIVYVSEATREMYRKQKVPSHPNEFIIPGGVQISSFPTLDLEKRRSHHPSRILFVGRICKEKGVREAIEALKLMGNDSVLEVVGDAQTPEQDAYFLTLKNTVNDSDVLKRRVSFSGRLEGLALVEAYARSSIFVCPSVWEEPAPMVIAEAMASGLPVVAFDTGGLRERIMDEEDGILVPKGDIATLKNALDDLLFDREKLERMSQNAAQRARMEFDRSVMAKSYLKIYGI